MAEEHEDATRADASNRTLVVIMAVVALLFIVGGLAIGKKKEEMMMQPTLPPANARALIVPTEDRARTVVVAPCGTDAADTARNQRKDRATPNTIRFDLPRGSGDRAVLVPDCSPQAGVSASASGIPSAAFILPVGTRENSLQIPPLRAESQLIVPQGGKARTVVLGPCSGLQGGEAGKPVPAKTGGQSQDAVLEPEAGQGTVVTAAQC